jgi:hypothetical protein
MTCPLRAATLLGCAALAGAAAGCSLAFDLGRQQCENTSDCEIAGFKGAVCKDHVCVPPAGPGGPGGGGAGAGAGSGAGGSGGAPDPAWACLGSFQTPQPPAGQNIAYQYRFEYATQANVVPAGLTVKLCSSLDVDCQTPVTIPPPDAKGVVAFDQPPSFRGFLDVTSDDTMHSFAYLESPIVLPPKENLVRLIRPNEFTAILAAAQQTYDPMRGIAVVLTDDCLDERSAGVALETLQTDPKTVGFYFRGNLPDLKATSTDDEGAGGYLNLPISLITVDAKRADTKQLIGEASFQSRPGVISYVFVGPTPG